MKKKGFTLIELLAVIVILAIIALIAVPIVLNMIENARKSAAKSSAYGYIQAIDDNNELAEMDDDYQTGKEPIEGTKQVSQIDINIKGKKPTKGTVTIGSDGNVSSATLCINNYKVTYQAPEVTDVEQDNSYCGGSSTPAASPQSFATDSWATIAANTTSNVYNVGDTRCIALTGLTTTNDNGCENGEFKIRIANKTACTTETSKTACGFVVEFVDVIAEHNMNPSGTYKETQYDYGWNVDGYPASAMYNEYFASNATNSLYAKLPSDLQSAIISTTVKSGHGSTSGETNFTSNDKLYLLSITEVGFDVDYDSAKTETRKLDYYDEGTGADAKAKRVKQYNGSNKIWWLRSANSLTTSSVYIVNSDGSGGSRNANSAYGVAPAFRIGTNS